MLERFLSIDRIGIIFMVIAAFIGYGSKNIAKKILNCSSDKAEKYSIILKLIAIFMAVMGMLKVFNKI